MNKPTLNNVKEFFEGAGWSVEVDYDSDMISLSADKMVGQPAHSFEQLEVEFAYQPEDMPYADDEDLDEIEEYLEIFGDRVNYNGTPGAVEIFEKEFGAISIADMQTATGEDEDEIEENTEKMKLKSIAAVEKAFKSEGYVVQLQPSDLGTEIETWSISCFTISTSPEMLTIYHGTDEEDAQLLGEEHEATAAHYGSSVKYDNNFFYYGTPLAEHLFGCVLPNGEIDKEKLATFAPRL